LLLILTRAGAAQSQGVFTTLYDIPAGPGLPVVASGGDYDGDGYEEFAVGIPKANSWIGLVRVYSGVSGTLLAEYHGNPTYSIPAPFCPNPSNCGEAFGASLAFIDLNADGIEELVVSATFASTSISGVLFLLGRIAAYSAFLMPPVVEYIPTINGSNFGAIVANGGDLNADGFPDLLVSSPGYDIPGAGFFNTGAAWALAGPILQPTLFFAAGVQPGEGFGGGLEGGLVGVGDVDGDGHDDWAVASPQRHVAGIPFAGSVFLFSGATGTVLLQWSGSSLDEHLGYAITAIGDVNGDGIPDLVFTDFPLPPFNLSPQKLYVASGATGAYLYVLSSPGAFGAIDRLHRVRDVSGDGVDEFVVRDILSTPTTFILGIKVFSGADGATLYSEECVACPLGFGNYLSGAGDVNGDGLGDFVVAAEGSFGGPVTGKVLVYVGRSLTVVGNPVIGGMLNLALNVPSWPGQPYVLAFSMGNSGFVAAGYWIPLTPDSLFFDSLNAGIMGVLDGSGQGGLSFPIPNSPALHGLTFYAAGAVLNASTPPALGAVLPAAKVTIP
jgi:hypothetical protein